MSIISVFPGKGKAKLEAGSASPLTYAKTYTPSADNEGFSSFKVNAMPSGALATPSIQQPNANGRVYATAGVSAAGYIPTTATKDNYIDLPVRSADTITPGKSPLIAVSKGRFTTGDVVVDGDVGLIPGNIRKGANIFGIDGDAEGYIGEISSEYRYYGLINTLAFSVNTSNLIAIFAYLHTYEDDSLTAADEGERVLQSVFVDIPGNIFYVTAYRVDYDDDKMLTANGTITVVGNITVADDQLVLSLPHSYYISGYYTYFRAIYAQ